jgi:hypothetical protein
MARRSRAAPVVGRGREGRAPLALSGQPPHIRSCGWGRAALCGRAVGVADHMLPSREASILRAFRSPPCYCWGRAVPCGRATGAADGACRSREVSALCAASSLIASSPSHCCCGAAPRRQRQAAVGRGEDVACRARSTPDHPGSGHGRAAAPGAPPSAHAGCRSRSAFVPPSNGWGDAAPCVAPPSNGWGGCGDAMYAADCMPRSRETSTLRAVRAPLPLSSHCWGVAAPYHERRHRLRVTDTFCAARPALAPPFPPPRCGLASSAARPRHIRRRWRVRAARVVNAARRSRAFPRREPLRWKGSVARLRRRGRVAPTPDEHVAC